MTALSELLDCAVAAAQTAGGHALENFHRRHDVVQRAAHDVKLQLDLECQAKAEETIRRRFPEHRLMGEEGGDYAADAEPLWIIDPIDGTVNFTHGLPIWCCSVAVRVGGRVAAGAVFAPMLNECFYAALDQPAQCNGRPIQVSAVAQLDEALVLTGLYKGHGIDSPSMDYFRALSGAVQKARIMGAAAVDICHVAAGRADAYFEPKIYVWDVAAAGLIVERAGGRIEVLEQYDAVSLRYFCSNGLIHDRLRAVLAGGVPPG